MCFTVICWALDRVVWARFRNALDHWITGINEIRDLALGLVKGFFPIEQTVGMDEENGVLASCPWSSCRPASCFLQQNIYFR